MTISNNQRVGMVWTARAPSNVNICNCCRSPWESNSALFFPSDCDATINLQDPSGKVCAPSQFRINIESTTNWKSVKDVNKAIINLNARKVVGANHAPTKINLTIYLNDKLGVILLNVVFHAGPTISSCRRPTLKWDGEPRRKSFVVCRFAFDSSNSFDDIWAEAMHPARSDFFPWHSPRVWVDAMPLTRCEELVART